MLPAAMRTPRLVWLTADGHGVKPRAATPLYADELGFFRDQLKCAKGVIESR